MSAPDLIVDYFRRDLDGAEDEALAAQLQASPAEAERFAQLAAKDYRAFGLPEPGETLQRRAGGLKWLLLLLIVGGGAAFAWTLRPAKPGVLTVSRDDAGFDVVERKPAYETPERLPDEAPAAVEAPALHVSAETPRGPFDIRVSGAKAEADGVFDAQGRRVADLTALDARRFRWDGRDEQGRLARPGAYQIRLLAQGAALKQWVEIEVR